MTTVHVDDFSPGGMAADLPIDLTSPTKALMYFAKIREVAAELARRGPEAKDFDPRERRDGHGKWTRTGGGLTHGIGAPGAVFDNIKVDGTPGGSGTVDDPIAVGRDLDRAVKLLGQGKHIRLDSGMQVSTLLDKLAAVVRDAEKRKSKAPNYDLCLVTIPGTNLFCADSVGVPRAQMPQLKGFPVEGSPAAARVGGDLSKKVSIEDDFRAALLAIGVKTTRRQIPASHLKASQAELSGSGVSAMVQALRDGTLPDRPTFVTRDGYIIDGHHRWAANVALDLQDGKLGDVMMDAEVIDMDIGAALDYARAFADAMGIKSVKLGEAGPPKVTTKSDDLAYYEHIGGLFERLADRPVAETKRDVATELRDVAGRWSRGGAVAHALANMPISPRQEQERTGLKDPVKANAGLLNDPTRMENLPPKVRTALTSKVREVFGVTPEQMHTNLSAVFARAGAGVRAQGSAWYGEAGDQAHQIALDTGYAHNHVVGAVAALSPQMEWGANIALAEYLTHSVKNDWPIDASTLSALSTQTKTKQLRDKSKLTLSLLDWAKVEVAKTKGSTVTWPDTLEGTKLSDHEPLVQAALIKAMGQAGLHTSDGQPLGYFDDVRLSRKAVSYSSGLNGMSKAIRILGSTKRNAEEPADVLNGHKVRSFYNNIMFNESNPHPDVTIDTHALSAAVGRAIPASSKLMTKGFQAPARAPLGLKGTYPVFADAYRRIAEENGMSAHQAQAIIWLQWRQEHP